VVTCGWRLGRASRPRGKRRQTVTVYISINMHNCKLKLPFVEISRRFCVRNLFQHDRSHNMMLFIKNAKLSEHDFIIRMLNEKRWFWRGLEVSSVIYVNYNYNYNKITITM